MTPLYNPHADPSHAPAASDITDCLRLRKANTAQKVAEFHARADLPADLPADCTDVAIWSVIILILALFLAAIGWGAATLLGSVLP